MPNTTVVLDDLQRPAERDVLTQWQAETPWRFQINYAASVAIGTRS